MEKEEYKNIREIRYPNNTTGDCQTVYRESMGNSFECVMESGEMAGIAWIAVFKEGKKIAQIKQSVCDIYFKE